MEPILGNIITAFITGGLALIGVIFSNMSNHHSIENQLKISQAVTDTKIDNLTDEVKKHNNFAEKIPVIENDIKNIKEDLNGFGSRVSQLEQLERDRSL